MKKFSELAGLSNDELVKQRDEAYKALYEARFKRDVHQLNDTSVFRRNKHLIAQVETVLSRRQQEAVAAAQPQESH